MLLWASDIHLDFLQPEKAIKSFGEYLRKENPKADGLIITGDIAVGVSLVSSLEELSDGFGLPIYFVLGNHDRYYSSFKEVELEVNKLVNRRKNIYWINNNVIDLSNKIKLIGCDGWYDARYGFGADSNILLSDWDLIKDLTSCKYDKCFREILNRECADGFAKQLSETLNSISNVNHVIITTHIPPYIGAAWHEGKISDNNSLPWFSSKATGDAIDRFAAENLDVSVTVLCGHTHSPGIYRPSENVVVYTGKAEYYYPALCGYINLDPVEVVPI
jgi:UDP-2,3-diacylglucosamine pyrophosphatase LpxH